MAGNSFGQLFRISTAGESHGPGNLVIIDGLPSGIKLITEDFIPDLRRRRPGQSSITSQRHEEDIPEILSGTFEGKTTGTSLAIYVRNTDVRSTDYLDIKEKYRPGHADYTFDKKYGIRDYRGGGRSSARETVVRVTAGTVAKKVLKHYGYRIVILGYVKQIGNIIAKISNPSKVTASAVEANVVRCPDTDAAQKMINLIEAVRSDRDSIGGIAEIVATGVPPGWGEPVFDKLKADLAKALFSLPAVTGVEFGAGFQVASRRGSENNDEFVRRGDRIITKTNHHGGILGGISSGMPIIIGCAVKPTSSIPRDQKTVSSKGKSTSIVTKGRHDPCLLPRFIPIAEAMTAIVLADHCLRQHVNKKTGNI
jgi:chorismate synthase